MRHDLAVVGIDDRDGRFSGVMAQGKVMPEETLFGPGVCLASVVKIEVIRAEVCPDGGVEAQAVDASLHDAMAGHFHGHELAPGRGHVVQKPVEFQRARRGVEGIFLIPRVSVGNRPDDARAQPEASSQGFDELRGGGLSVCPGDGHQFHESRRSAVEGFGDVPQVEVGGEYGPDGHPRGKVKGGIRINFGGAGLDGLLSQVQSLCLGQGNGALPQNINISGTHLASIVDDALRNRMANGI